MILCSCPEHLLPKGKPINEEEEIIGYLTLVLAQHVLGKQTGEIECFMSLHCPTVHTLHQTTLG